MLRSLKENISSAQSHNHLGTVAEAESNSDVFGQRAGADL